MCDSPKDFVCSLDGKMIFVLDCFQEKVNLKGFDLESNTLLVKFPYENQYQYLNISPDGQYIYSFNR